MTAAYRIDPEERSERLRLRETTTRIGAELRSRLEEVTEAPAPPDWLELLRMADERLRRRA